MCIKIIPVPELGLYRVIKYLSNMATTITKRQLRDKNRGTSIWAEATAEERLKAVETINRLGEPGYAEQTFPRIYRIIRKA